MSRRPNIRGRLGPCERPDGSKMGLGGVCCGETSREPDEAEMAISPGGRGDVEMLDIR